MNQNNEKADLKKFFIKLIAVILGVIIVINFSYNLIFAGKLETINKLFNLNDKENIKLIKDKIRLEIKSGLDKDKILNEEDRMLLYKFYLKLKNEFKEIEEN
jgi:cell division protein YceG involved in septum cleavage